MSKLKNIHILLLFTGISVSPAFAQNEMYSVRLLEHAMRLEIDHIYMDTSTFEDYNMNNVLFIFDKIRHNQLDSIIPFISELNIEDKYQIKDTVFKEYFAFLQREYGDIVKLTFESVSRYSKSSTRLVYMAKIEFEEEVASTMLRFYSENIGDNAYLAEFDLHFDFGSMIDDVTKVGTKTIELLKKGKRAKLYRNAATSLKNKMSFGDFAKEYGQEGFSVDLLKVDKCFCDAHPNSNRVDYFYYCDNGPYGYAGLLFEKEGDDLLFSGIEEP